MDGNKEEELQRKNEENENEEKQHDIEEDE